MGNVTGEHMSGGRHRRRHEWECHWRTYEWGTSLEKAWVGNVTGEGMSGERHWRRHEWGTSLENI